MNIKNKIKFIINGARDFNNHDKLREYMLVIAKNLKTKKQ